MIFAGVGLEECVLVNGPLLLHRLASIIASLCHFTPTDVQKRQSLFHFVTTCSC